MVSQHMAPLERVDDERAAALVEAAVEATEAHVGQVLQPLKVRDNDTARVEVHVWQHDNAARVQDGIRSRRGRAVGALGDDLGLDLRARQS